MHPDVDPYVVSSESFGLNPYDSSICGPEAAISVFMENPPNRMISDMWLVQYQPSEF